MAAKIPPTKAMAIAALPTAFHPDFAFDAVVFKSGSDSGEFFATSLQEISLSAPVII